MTMLLNDVVIILLMFVSIESHLNKKNEASESYINRLNISYPRKGQQQEKSQQREIRKNCRYLFKVSLCFVSKYFGDSSLLLIWIIYSRYIMQFLVQVGVHCPCPTNRNGSTGIATDFSVTSIIQKAKVSTIAIGCHQYRLRYLKLNKLAVPSILLCIII